MKNSRIRNYISRSFACLFYMAASIVLGSCDIGLGPAVDLAAPEIEVTSHKDNDAVGSVFAIRGTATDNEKVTKITIDFTDADIHYQIVPGSGPWQKKTEGNPVWTTINNDPNYYCNVNGNNIEWSIGVDSDDKASSKTDNSYTLEASAFDNAGNSGRKSKAVITITIDENNPVVSVYKPELTTGKYTDLETASAGYKLKDGNVISRLMNGNIVLQGRQSKALAFKALRIEFDDGKQESGIARNPQTTAVETMEQLLELSDADLGDDPKPKIYYAKDMTGLDLREWSLTVRPEDWVTEENGLKTGKHIIRVVSTSLTASNAWERKILGYFVWWPEADKPWITAPIGDTEEKDENLQADCYPGSSISGSAQDDDGIKSIVSTVYKKDADGNFKKYEASGYTNPVSHSLPQQNAKYSAWSIEVPSLNGAYRYDIKVTDIHGNYVEEQRFFKTSDVSAPKIELTAPLDNSSAILNAEGNLSFNVTATDDGKIELFALCWLNPALRSTSANKIKYLTGSDSNWNNATAEGFVDDAGNIIYRLDDGEKKNRYELKNRSFNLYNPDKKLGFNIGGTDRNGKKIPLSAQDFIFLASDGSKNTVKAITLSGDNITPEKFTIKDITIGDVKKEFTGDVPVFASSAYGQTATITGEWKDYLTSETENKTRIYVPEVTWGKATASASISSDGTWSATVVAPAGGGTITATLTDFGGNKKVVQEAASIESTESGLSRIDCRTDDGSYSTGKDILITLEFTKNVDVDTTGGTPTLTLDNGGTATYVSGSGETSHVFKYTIGTKTTEENLDTPNLYVTAINQNNAKWKETGSGEDITTKVKIPENNTALKDNIKTTRKIKIDNTKPKVKTISTLSSPGYYSIGSSLLFLLEFDEDVTVTGASGLNMQFTHKNNSVDVKTQSSVATGSKYVLMTYTVAAGDNANPIAFKQLNASGVTVTDDAGNVLSEWGGFTAPSFAGFVVDTQKPATPSFGSWDPGDLIIDDAGTSFTLSGTEPGASVEYSLDGGNSWLPYAGRVSITNNGSYDVTARQTDMAGNESVKAAVKSFVINKGVLFKKITADSRSGTYTDSKTATPTVITGKLEFRTAVKIASGATVTLNVKNGANASKTVPIKECRTTAAEKDIFTFEYTVVEGDSIEANGKLDVIGWSFNSVTLGGKNVSIALPASGNAQRLNENRDIKILTGRPTKSETPEFVGEGEDGVLKIKFDRDIEKGIGDIEFEYDETISGNVFHVPTVLTAEEYGELSGSDVISGAYIIGMNGATASGTTLTNDTSTKYILDYAKTDIDSAVVGAFKAANKHKVVVPIISDAVQVIDGDTLRVSLGETYKLPVKGAKYKVMIPASAVYDEVQNGNALFDYTFTAPGVEAPQIRLKKTAYTITGTPGTTTSTNAKMEDAQKAYMKIDCRTPGATLKYDAHTVPTTAVRVNKKPYTQNTKTASATVNDPDTNYSGQVTLGDDKVVNSFDAAQGLKIAISASAAANGATAYAYEYANRTVLKFVISGKYSVQGGISNQQLETNIEENGSKLKIKDLKVWVIGGDAASGLNSLDPFPLSWGDSSNFKLMQESGRNNNDSDGDYKGNWWWVTWDLSAPACHGFVIGDVPTDAAKNGPTMWYAGECAWTPFKENYWLHPGETLIMAIEDAGDYKDSYLFRLKNEGHR
ncbi:hypothetical protein [Treponema sp.]|uniref:hypothetical protein n=1 Tax=Treponema sp. TaxID=166 RepID=UPI00388EF044